MCARVRITFLVTFTQRLDSGQRLYALLVYAGCGDSHLTDKRLRQLIVGDARHHRLRERGLGDRLGDTAKFGRCRREHGQIRLRLIHIHRDGTHAHLIGPGHMHLMLTAAAEEVCRDHRLKIIAGQRSQRGGLLTVVVGYVRWLLRGFWI